jgi:hypothetical protein
MDTDGDGCRCLYDENTGIGYTSVCLQPCVVNYMVLTMRAGASVGVCLISMSIYTCICNNAGIYNSCKEIKIINLAEPSINSIISTCRDAEKTIKIRTQLLVQKYSTQVSSV